MSSVGRIIAAIVLGALMLFPGVELLRFVFEDVLRVCVDMSQTDCLLFFVIVLLCALLLQQGTGRERRSSDEPDLRLAGHKPPGGRRRSPDRASGRKRTREPSRRRTRE